MSKLCKVKNIEVFTVAVFIITVVVLIIVFGDPSNLQSAHEKDIILEPCRITNGTATVARQFSRAELPSICGRVASDYLPVELRYYLVNSNNGDEILSFEYVKITDREFTVQLPAQLDPGQYRFELRAGGRRHIAETSFTVSP